MPLLPLSIVIPLVKYLTLSQGEAATMNISQNITPDKSAAYLVIFNIIFRLTASASHLYLVLGEVLKISRFFYQFTAHFGEVFSSIE